jgi:hypothetical protein
MKEAPEDERLDAPFVVVREIEISSLNSCGVSSPCEGGGGIGRIDA